MKTKSQEQPKSPSKLTAMLNVDFEDPTQLWLTEQRTLRRLIGILGMALPLLLIGVIFIDVGHFRPMDSISHYYFTRASSIFIIVVSLLAIFLLIYKGHGAAEFYLSTLAGICALLLIMFPTSNITSCGDVEKIWSITVLRQSGLDGFRIGFHYASAGIFLLSLAIMSIFLFTNGPRSIKKKLRNSIYVGCGILMITALLFIGLRFFEIGIPTEYYDRNQLTFWFEAIAIECFGISWLIKGETLFRK